MLTIASETKKSIREAFGKKLEELGSENSNIVVLDADLANSTQTKFFAKKFPERFFDCGIAEQNMAATAAGLALEGKIPVFATFAVFATGRVYDQIRSSICYQNANVTIIRTRDKVCNIEITIGDTVYVYDSKTAPIPIVLDDIKNN